MKAIILAGGFATRLYPFTEGLPKPLLPVAGRPIINYIIDNIEKCEDIDEIIISTNKKFESHFKNWLKGITSAKKIKIIAEDVSEEGEKLGTIGALNFLLNTQKLEDCLIVGGDNLFDFEISDFVRYYMEIKKPVIAVYDIKDLEKVKNKFGVVTLEGSKIVNFVEKPSRPETSLISTCCYIFPKHTLNLIPKYLKEGNPKDAPGHFISWLRTKQEIHGFVFDSNWFDIGSIDSLKAANEFIAEKMSEK
jgi:glucose-1-phosphate thymidylyltransferase